MELWTCECHILLPRIVWLEQSSRLHCRNVLPVLNWRRYHEERNWPSNNRDQVYSLCCDAFCMGMGRSCGWCSSHSSSSKSMWNHQARVWKLQHHRETLPHSRFRPCAIFAHLHMGMWLTSQYTLRFYHIPMWGCAKLAHGSVLVSLCTEIYSIACIRCCSCKILTSRRIFSQWLRFRFSGPLRILEPFSVGTLVDFLPYIEDFWGTV